MDELACNVIIIFSFLLMKGRATKDDMLVNEVELVEQAKHDDQAFEVLYDFYSPKIYGYLFKRVGNVDITQDLVSATFISVFTNLKDYKYLGYPFSAWVYRIATNNLIDYYRKSSKKKEVNIEEIKELRDENSSSPDELFCQSQDRELVQQVLKNLPVKYQEVLSLKFFGDKDNTEIAQILKTNENNVRVMIFRALKIFKELHEKHK